MKKSLAILLAVLVLAVGLLISCDTGNTPSALTLSAEGGVTTLEPGKSVQLLVNGEVPEAGAYTFAFDTGAAYATVVRPTMPPGKASSFTSNATANP